MSTDPTIELSLLKIRSLIADKEMVVATANKELALGGWLSDHQGHIDMLNADIDANEQFVRKYS